EGYRVSDEQTIARVLQARLSRPVANLGVAGYGPMQELVVLKREGARLKPSVVVWFFFEGNDVYDDENFEALLKDQETRADPSDKANVRIAQQSWSRRSFTLNALSLLRLGVRSIGPKTPYPYFGYLSLPGSGNQTVYFLEVATMIPWGGHEAACWERSRK